MGIYMCVCVCMYVLTSIGRRECKEDVFFHWMLQNLSLNSHNVLVFVYFFIASYSFWNIIRRSFWSLGVLCSGEKADEKCKNALPSGTFVDERHTHSNRQEFVDDTD